MFKMAYAIQCHKNSSQVIRLIESLDNGNSDFFIHVDRKADITKFNIKRKNVYILTSRVDVQWGGFSQVEATLRLFNEIRLRGEYSYIHLISGQDFPLKPKHSIEDFFRQNEGSQFIEYVPLPHKHLSRVEVFYPKFIIGRGSIGIIRGVYKKIVDMIKPLKRDTSNLPHLYKGSSWFSITGECMSYILDFVQRDKNFYSFFKNSICCDEIFFQTIVVNSPFGQKIVNDNLRYIDWSNKKSNSPKTLTVNDFDALINTKKLFSRKFDTEVDGDILSKLEKCIAGTNVTN